MVGRRIFVRVSGVSFLGLECRVFDVPGDSEV